MGGIRSGRRRGDGRPARPRGRAAGRRSGADGHTHEKNCLNCGAPLTGPYCSACGQKAHVHRSVRAFFHDFLHGLFNFEGKIWRTLPMLAWRPGELTRRYIAGERARFISPVALFLFTVFVMFAVLNFTGTLEPDGTARTCRTAVEDRASPRSRSQLAKLEAKRKARRRRRQGRRRPRPQDRQAQGGHRREPRSAAQRQAVIARPTSATRRPSWIRPFIENARDNPELVSMKVQDAASKYSWLLIPLSVPFMWLLFPFRRRYNTYDHAVFVTYSLSFMMMLVIVGSLLVAVGLVDACRACCSSCRRSTCTGSSRALTSSGGSARSCAPSALVTFAFIAAGTVHGRRRSRSARADLRRRPPPGRRSRPAWAAWPWGSTSRPPGSPGPWSRRGRSFRRRAPS